MLNSNRKDPIPAVVNEKPIDIVLAADCVRGGSQVTHARVLNVTQVYFEPAFPLLEKTLVDLVKDNTVVFFCFKKRRRVCSTNDSTADFFNTLVQADLHFIKSIKKRLNVREVKDDPEFSKHDADYEKYSRENLFLYVRLRFSPAWRCADSLGGIS